VELADHYRPPGREARECKYWWFDAWDWLINRAMQVAGCPHIETRAGQVAIDPHIHTMFSHCSISRPDRIIRRAAAIGLGGVGIMDHNHEEGIVEAQRCADDLKRRKIIPEDFLIIPATEVNSAIGHVGGLFIHKELPGPASLEEIVLAYLRAASTEVLS